MLKLSVYTLSLPTLAPPEAAELVSSLGFTGIEWRYSETTAARSGESPSFTGNNLCTIDPGSYTAQTVAKLCATNGLVPVGLAPYLDVGDIDGFRRVATYAREIGARNIRLRAPSIDGRGFPELFSEGRAFFEAVEEVARETGVRGLLEMHQRTLCASASMAERMVRGLDPAQVGVIYDVGNLVLEGYEDPRMGLSLLGPYLAHVHLKNAGWGRGQSASGGHRWVSFWSPLDEGMLDIASFLALLDDSGYAGWVSLEDLCTNRDCMETLAFNASLLRQWGFMNDPGIA